MLKSNDLKIWKYEKNCKKIEADTSQTQIQIFESKLAAEHNRIFELEVGQKV